MLCKESPVEVTLYSLIVLELRWFEVVLKDEVLEPTPILDSQKGAGIFLRFKEKRWSIPESGSIAQLNINVNIPKY